MHMLAHRRYYFYFGFYASRTGRVGGRLRD